MDTTTTPAQSIDSNNTSINPTPLPQVNISSITTSENQTTKKKPHSTLLGILLGIFALLGCLSLAILYFQIQIQKNQPQNKVSSQIPTNNKQQPKTLIIGTDATFPPMEFMDKQGSFVGFDIDLGDKISRELGIKTQFKNVKWDDIFTSLENKKIDVIISSVTITDERKQKYDFSIPYLNAGQVAITQRNNTTINTIADLKGKKIGVQKGTTNELEARKVTSSNLVIDYNDYQKATQALVNGQVDTILSDLTAAKGITIDNPSLKIATDPFTNDQYGIVFRKGENQQLEKKINEAINSLQTSGTLTYLRQKWLE